MHLIFTLLAVATLIGCLVSHIIILIDAFQDEVWKGVVGFIFPIYLLYYAIVDFDHDNKWSIICLWLFGGTLSVVFRILAQ